MTDSMIADAVHAVARHYGAPSPDFSEELWELFQAQGLTNVFVGATVGGSGGSFEDAATVVGAAAEESVSLPLAESIIAGWLLEVSGLPVPQGVRTIAVMSKSSFEEVDSVRNGQLAQVDAVPFARAADHVLLVCERENGAGVLAQVSRADVAVVEGCNVAGEARDQITVEPSAVSEWEPAGVGVDAVLRRLALLRAVMTLGACRRARDLTVRYTQEREQFGRPLARFQAVQQAVAGLVGEISVAEASLAMAMSVDPTKDETVAAAKVATGRAATAAFEVSHQMHGAIGFTREHPLHRSTTRLLAWRDEYGTDRDWAVRLGTTVIGSGGAELWPLLTMHPTVRAP